MKNFQFWSATPFLFHFINSQKSKNIVSKIKVVKEIHILKFFLSKKVPKEMGTLGILKISLLGKGSILVYTALKSMNRLLLNTGLRALSIKNNYMKIVQVDPHQRCICNFCYKKKECLQISHSICKYLCRYPNVPVRLLLVFCDFLCWS